MPKKIIAVHAIDHDGCVANSKYNEHKTEMSAITPLRDRVKKIKASNKILIESIQQINDVADEVILLNASVRQSHECDQFNLRENKHSGSCFPSLESSIHWRNRS